MIPRVAVPIFPGTNSEIETLRALQAAGCAAELVHWSRGARALRAFDAFVLPGGFAYEDRVRAGAVAAHDELTDAIIEAAAAGKFVLGICNGAQILLEAGLVPGTGPVRRPTAAFTPNADGGRYLCRHVHVRLAVEPARLPLLATLPREAVIPMWVAHGEGRLAAAPAELERLERDGHIAFVYCDAGGRCVAAPQGSALDCAGLANAAGTVVAIMPHPERDAWTFMHRDGERKERARGDVPAMLRPSGASVFFSRFRRRSTGDGGAMSAARRVFAVALSIPDNEAFTACATLRRLDIPVGRVTRAAIWIFAVEPAAAGDLGATLATLETVVNPNKHHLSERTGGRPLAGEVWIAALDDTALTSIAGRKIAGVTRIERQTAWQLFDERGTHADSALLDRAIETFLCNPAFQKATR